LFFLAVSLFFGRRGVELEFELKASGLQSKFSTVLSHTSSPFYSGYFEDEVSRIICPGWPQTVILLILASKLARITGVSHQRQASHFFLMFKYPSFRLPLVLYTCIFPFLESFSDLQV
jgi:hypothetical protein